MAFVINKNGQLIEFDGTLAGPKVIAEQCDDVLRGSIKEMKQRLDNKDITESLSLLTLH